MDKEIISKQLTNLKSSISTELSHTLYVSIIMNTVSIR